MLENDFKVQLVQVNRSLFWYIYFSSEFNWNKPGLTEYSLNQHNLNQPKLILMEAEYWRG